MATFWVKLQWTNLNYMANMSSKTWMYDGRNLLPGGTKYVLHTYMHAYKNVKIVFMFFIQDVNNILE